MSRGRSPLDSWTRADALTWEHESGAVVSRACNNRTGLIEWRARTPAGRITFTGQDLHDAIELALHHEEPTP